MMKFSNRVLVATALQASSICSHAQVTPAQTRGGLLYTTHCVACHTTQMHWRNDKQAIDWDSLKFQVRRWQGNAGLGWSESDIDGVSRYLNDTIYRYPTPAERVGLVSASTYMSIQPTK
jgi:mono/diheme cytochrome c family protein